MQGESNASSSKLKVASLVGALFCALMIVCLFLPYATATADTAAYYQTYAGVTVPEFGLTADQLMDISLAKFTQIYSTMWQGKPEGTLYIVLFVASVAFSALALLCFLAKRPTLSIINTALMLGVVLMQRYDYTSRGVVPSDHYVWGIAYYLMFVALAGALVAGAVLFVQKRHAKKAAAQEKAAPQGE